MNILVCVKQVPDTTEIKINPETNTLIREGVPSIVNPFDAYALEAAARIKDKKPDTKIVVMSMGPAQAMVALRECLAIAADKAYLVSGRKFGGSDTLATSYIISKAVKAVEELEGKFDVIFCGKQAIDGDTGQVGPELAEHLDYAQVTYALECEVAEDNLIVLREGQDGNAKIKTKLPAVVTFTKPGFEPRYPNVRRKMAANRAQIPVLGEDAFGDMDFSKVGLKGSPTHVKRSFVPVHNKTCVIVKEECDRDSARKLAEMLSTANVI